jgi:hypothetical protein
VIFPIFEIIAIRETVPTFSSSLKVDDIKNGSLSFSRGQFGRQTFGRPSKKRHVDSSTVDQMNEKVTFVSNKNCVGQMSLGQMSVSKMFVCQMSLS